METPIVPPSLVSPTTRYQYYFTHAEINTFCGRYATVLVPYYIDPANAAATTASSNVVRVIYARSQFMPTYFL